MLGEVLIQSLKNLHQGAGFKLYKDFKRTHKEFKALKEILKEFKEPSINTLKGISENKELFLKEYERIKELLKTHQNYPAILDNIFYNFSYFIQNFNLIKEWLLSSDFNQRYKKENHPYPSLLDPKKLNDENEAINYKNIPAKLAWDMNLPLPENYEFIIMCSHGAGFCALSSFLFLLGRFHAIDFFCGGDGDVRYGKFYRSLLELKNERNIISINDVHPLWYGNQDKRDKLYSSFQKITPILFLIRDPIELIKHAYGRKWGNNLAKTREFDLSYQFDDIVKEVQEYDYDLPDTLEGQRPQNFLWKTLKDCFKKFTDCTYLDISQIRGEQTIQTMQILAEKFHFSKPKREHEVSLTRNVFGGNLYFLLPLILYVNKDDLLKTKRNADVNKNIESIAIYIKILECNEDYIDISHKIDLSMTNNLMGVYIQKQDYFKLKNDDEFCKSVFLYIEQLVIKLYQRSRIEDDLMLKVEDVLEHLRNNQSARISAKNILDEELVYIKQQRPDIVASWKYYAEFEKICEELDKEDEEQKRLENSND